jgi:molecular chaperone Hsp33
MITADLGDSELAERLSALSPDGITRFALLGGSVRGALLSATTLAAQARANHGLGVVESLALSQAYLCALLVATTLKDGDRAALRMNCSGALRGFSVEATWDGFVRGYLFNEEIRLDKPLSSFDLKPFIGSGTLSLVRTSAGSEPFTGHIALVHGRIAEDLTEYFLRSEQTRTAIAASVRFDTSGRIAGAGGLFLQAMPGAEETDIGDAEDRLAELPSLGTWFSEGRSRAELLSEWFGAFEVDVLAETPAAFRCDCSRPRFASFLGALSGGELDSMIAEGPHPAELICHNCGSRYEFSKIELEGIAAIAAGAASAEGAASDGSRA